MEISFVSDNIMLVDGEVLKAKETSPEEFSRVIKVGRLAIIDAISDMYVKYRAKELENVDVQRGSVLAIRLGSKTLDVINRAYYYDKYTGLDYTAEGLKPKFKKYFEVVKGHDLIPEIRETASHQNVSGTNLYIGDTKRV